MPIRQVAPRCAGSQHPEDAIQDTPVIDAGNAARFGWQDWLDDFPFCLAERVSHEAGSFSELEITRASETSSSSRMSEEHAKAVVALAPDEGSSYPKRTFTAVQPIIAEDALCAQPSMPSAWTTCPRALKVNDMASDYFDRVYRTTEQNAVQDLYDDWAETYDADLIENGYVTPDRCAAALATHLPARDLPILDFACGTGLSGAAIAAQGFTLIDGVDLSEAMLNAARKRGVYRNLFKANPDQPPSAAPGDYAAIAAVGAISPGAAPATFFDALLSCLAPGGLFVLSYNDHALADPEHTSRLRRALDDGIVRERFREHGDHVVNLGSKSTVYVLEKLNRS